MTPGHLAVDPEALEGRRRPVAGFRQGGLPRTARQQEAEQDRRKDPNGGCGSDFSREQGSENRYVILYLPQPRSRGGEQARWKCGAGRDG